MIYCVFSINDSCSFKSFRPAEKRVSGPVGTGRVLLAAKRRRLPMYTYHANLHPLFPRSLACADNYYIKFRFWQVGFAGKSFICSLCYGLHFCRAVPGNTLSVARRPQKTPRIGRRVNSTFSTFSIPLPYSKNAFSSSCSHWVCDSIFHIKL